MVCKLEIIAMTIMQMNKVAKNLILKSKNKIRIANYIRLKIKQNKNKRSNKKQKKRIKN